MALEQTLGQKQRLLLSQSMQQSLEILQRDGVSLHDYLQEASLSNPLFEVPDTVSTAVDSLAGVPETQGPNLYEYLMSQIELRYTDRPLRKVVVDLINNLDKDGFLKLDVERYCKEQHVTKTVFDDALTILQSLDPVGVGARTLQEALILQAQAEPDCPPLVMNILQEHYLDFLHNDEHRILVATGATVGEYGQAKKFIGTFTARPGAPFNGDETQYRVPDLRIRPDGSGFKLYLTKYGKPQLVFNESEFDDLKVQVDADLEQYLRDKVSEYQALAHGVKRREDTILAIAKLVATHQWPYLSGEKAFIRPLILRDVANKLNLSESTVSRAMSGEYIDSPRGVLAMDSLLTKRGSLHNDDGVDNEAIASIRAVVGAEDKRKPLSDQKVADVLKNKFGITISRRTVAKYRSIAGIPDKKLRREQS
ncbi:RNA polymerase factor sigma-54 [Lacticaseibacillus zhaodongensis]|uniref:RNA polymerase factor sigma-54 n=1 Tax=Lacticaseibacillus zhaodongensis TaxID=2668065 RepID=UPI0012D35C84|nr:RNA polymerase factor sigma-54 [Lacticaseibacillus zhaodongensis]